MVAAGAVLCPVLLLLVAYLTGWMLLRHLWRRQAAVLQPTHPSP